MEVMNDVEKKLTTDCALPYTILISIGGWTRSRECTVSKDKVSLQVTTCYPCPTCIGRLGQLSQKMRPDVKYDLVSRANNMYYDITGPLPNTLDVAEVLSFLRFTTNFAIELIRGPEKLESSAQPAEARDSYAMHLTVSNWTSPRLCTVTQSCIKLQVATCYPCPVCILRVGEILKSIPPDVPYREVPEGHSLYFEFSSKLADSTSVHDVTMFLSRVLKLPVSFSSGLYPVDNSAEAAPPKLPDWKGLLKALQESPEMAADAPLGKLFRSELPVLICALQHSGAQIDRTLESLRSFAMSNVQEDLKRYQSNGMEKAAVNVLGGCGPNAKLFLLHCVSDASQVATLGADFERAIKEATMQLL